MSHWRKICGLHRILSARRHPVSRAYLMQELECSPATLKRVVASLQDDFGAPIVNVRGKGFFYQRTAVDRLELPGLWLTNEELHALALIDQLLEQIDPGLLDQPLAPVRERIAQMKALLPADGSGMALIDASTEPVFSTLLVDLAVAVTFSTICTVMVSPGCTPSVKP